jgi:alkyl sulfatase BDS1-like metallo-beta-lactamase superfamily hydrolase
MAREEDLGQPMRPASLHTCQANAATLRGLDFSDKSCFEDAQRGFVATIPDARILAANGKPIWDLSRFDFLDDEESPDSVNASLWRLARLNRIHGLFKVTDRVYQVRGFDLANMTIIEGDSGLILVDPLTVCESAAAALKLYRDQCGDRPVVAVIYTHSHVDHYGGVEGVITSEDAASGKVMVIAPDGFLREVISENILAGVPMRRRALFQFGPTLPPGVRGHVDSGLGKVTGRGTVSLIAPNRIITEPIEKLVVDGVEIVFQLTPETEAPAEMNFFLPQMRVLDLAENGCHTMHNLCPLRGAKTRDALAWSKYLDAALDTFINDTDVVIAQHHWPTWGQERVRAFITEQRDTYRYLHDQTLRLMSHGMTPNEIANAVRMPDSLASRWHARPYYGAIEHNVRAIYAHYMGPYDGNPVNLNPLTPEAAARKYVEYMGGAEAVLARARTDFEAGDYRWVVHVTHHLVFADPSNLVARALAADAMEQLGYQSESATWRSAYLLGAREYRLGVPQQQAVNVAEVQPRVAAMMPMEMFFDFLAIRVNAERADGLSLLIDWEMEDENGCWRLTLSHCALSHRPGSHGKAAQATVRMNRAGLSAVLVGGTPFADALAQGSIPVDGDVEAVKSLFSLFDRFAPNFNVIEP